MNRVLIRFTTCPRLMILGAAFLNLIHPLIHGTVLDGGALDTMVLALDGAAMTCCFDD